MKTIKVEDQDWELLQRQKLDLKLNKIADVVNKLLKIKKSLEREIRDAGRTNIIQLSVLRRILENE